MIKVQGLIVKKATTPSTLQATAKQISKLTNKTIVLPMVCAISTITLLGCQTTSTLNQQEQNTNVLLDQAFAMQNAKTVFDNQQALQLFNTKNAPSTSQIAKDDFYQALVKNLNTPHQSIARINYYVRPYPSEEGIDKGNNSIYRTLLNTYLYSLKNPSEEDNENQAVLAELAEDLSEEELKELADSLEAADAEKDSSELSKLKKFAANYQKMKQEADIPVSSDVSDNEIISSDRVIKLLVDGLYSSPKQVEALQAYAFDYYSVNVLQDYHPEKRLYQGVFSLDYANKTQKLSAQLPYSLNFADSALTVDTAIAKPILAIVSPEQALALDRAQSHTIKFRLPDAVLSQVPTDVLFDAMIAGIKVAFAEIDSEHFTAVDIRRDNYAKKLGATKAIKLNFNSTQSGDFISRVIKTIGNELQQDIDDNPERYQDAMMLQIALAAWGDVATDFRATDVGNVFQVIEGIAPIRLNNNAYYYLSADNELLGTQSKLSLENEFYGMTTESLTQTSYQPARVQQSALYPLFVEDFGSDAQPAIDGNALLAQIDKDKTYQEKAAAARTDYEYQLDQELNKSEISDDSDFNSLDELLQFTKTVQTGSNNRADTQQKDNADVEDNTDIELEEEQQF